jgi:hypothetical protein
MAGKWRKNIEFLVEFMNEPKWKNRIAFYVFFFACVSSAFGLAILLMSAFLPNYHFLQTGVDEDNARYMLSALVQSLAAVIAIVVTLSLVAIQLSAQSYSSRVIDVYRRTPDIWILMSIYVTTIFFGLATIWIIGTDSFLLNGVLSLEFLIFAAYFLGLFAFVCLMPYIWNTLALLNPSSVISLLAEDITEEKRSTIGPGVEAGETEKKDPLLPIIDIIIGSMMKYDYATMRIGSVAIVNRANELLNKENGKKFARYLYDHMERVSRLALKREDDEACFISLNILSNTGIKIAEKEWKRETEKAMEILHEIGIKSAENEWERETEIAIKELHEIGIKSAENEWERETEIAIKELHEIGIKTVENKWSLKTAFAIKALREIGIIAAEKEWKWSTGYTIEALYEIGVRLTGNEWDWEIEFVVKVMHEIGKKTTENGWYWTTQNVLDLLSKIAIKTTENKRNDITKIANRAIADIEKRRIQTN